MVILTLNFRFHPLSARQIKNLVPLITFRTIRIPKTHPLLHQQTVTLLKNLVTFCTARTLLKNPTPFVLIPSSYLSPISQKVTQMLNLRFPGLSLPHIPNLVSFSTFRTCQYILPQLPSISTTSTFQNSSFNISIREKYFFYISVYYS